MKPQNESFEHITSFDSEKSKHTPQTQSISSVCTVFQIDKSRTKPVIPKKYKSISELTSKLVNTPERIAALEAARKIVTSDLYKEDGNTLRTYRLQAGMSQAQLADAIGTSQPHIARIERGTENITLETCRRISKILNIDMNTLDAAIKTQQALLSK